MEREAMTNEEDYCFDVAEVSYERGTSLYSKEAPTGPVAKGE